MLTDVCCRVMMDDVVRDQMTWDVSQLASGRYSHYDINYDLKEGKSSGFRYTVSNAQQFSNCIMAYFGIYLAILQLGILRGKSIFLSNFPTFQNKQIEIYSVNRRWMVTRTRRRTKALNHFAYSCSIKGIKKNNVRNQISRSNLRIAINTNHVSGIGKIHLNLRINSGEYKVPIIQQI